jgi:hypothetical protein
VVLADVGTVLAQSKVKEAVTAAKVDYKGASPYFYY